MDTDRQRAKEQMKALPFKEKMANFWFYYKIHIIVISAAAIVLGYSAVQCSRRIDYDLDISFYNSYYIEDEKIEKLNMFLKDNIKDTNQNGSVDARAYLYTAQIDGEFLDQNAQAVIARLQTELASGECQAYIMDEAFKKYTESVFGNMEVIEKVIEIESVPEIKNALELADGEKLYWISVFGYDKQKDKPEIKAERESVKLIESILEKTK